MRKHAFMAATAVLVSATLLPYQSLAATIDQNQILINAPYVSQVTGGSWANPILADACEEAAILTAVSWASDRGFTPKQLHDQLIGMSQFEQKTFGFYQDTSAWDTAWLMNQRFGVKSNVQYDIGTNDLIAVLQKGNIAIVPINGQQLKNPHYSKPAPPRHTVVVIGYIPGTNQFILDDPGTKFGAGYKVSAVNLQNALRDYSSGKHKPVKARRTAMIEVWKQASPQQ